ncbi:MAG: hypothetical protein AAF456_21770 [Planctomycetota bacterium]
MTQSKRFLPIWLAAALVCCLFPVSSIATGNDTARDLQTNVRKLNTWLGQGPAADRWRASLGLHTLQTQAALGHSADPGALSVVLAAFNSGAPGLEHPAFNDVRLALNNHLTQLQAQSRGDLLTEIANARYQFRPATVTDLQESRDKAVYDMQVMYHYFRMRVNSRDRALAYHTLDIYNTLDYLRGLTFEIPPEISAGKLDAQLEVLNEQLRDATNALDALPVFENDQPEIPEVDPLEPPMPDDGGQPAIEGPGGGSAPQDNAQQDDAEAQQREQSRQLTAQIEKLKQEIEELTRVRADVAAQDRPRRERRAEVLTELDRINRSFTEVADTMGDAYFAASRDSFLQFYMLYFYSTNDNLRNQFERQVESLMETAGNIGRNGSRRDAARAGGIIGWLDSSGQAGNLVSAIRARHSFPNAQISISEQLVNRIAGRDTNEARRLNEILLGRLMKGVAYTQSRVSYDFIRNPSLANVSVQLYGTTDSRTYTNAGPIRAHSGGLGQFEARRTLLANTSGIVARAPYGAANINSQFYGVDSRLRIVQRLAQKQFDKDQAAGEAESSRRLKSEVMARFVSETENAINNLRMNLASRLEASRNQVDQTPQIYLRTTDDRIYAFAKRETMSDLAATHGPDASVMMPEIALRVHESLLSNYINTEFAGRTYTNEELIDKLIETISRNGEGPSDELLEMKSNSSDEPFSITFAQNRPIEIQFEDNAVYLNIYGTRFRKDGNTIRTGLSIRVKFLIKRSGTEMRLVRDGEVEIDYLGDNPPNARDVTFKSFLETRMNNMFEEENDGAEAAGPEGIVLPDRLLPVNLIPELAGNRIAQDLQLVQCRMQNGWIYIGWNHVPGSAYGYYASVPMDTPGIWQELTINGEGGQYLYPSEPLPAPGNQPIGQVVPPLQPWRRPNVVLPVSTNPAQPVLLQQGPFSIVQPSYGSPMTLSSPVQNW